MATAPLTLARCTSLAAPTMSAPGAGRGVFWGTTLILFAAFWINYSQPTISRTLHAERADAPLEGTAVGGNLIRQATFPAFAAGGVLLLVAAAGRGLGRPTWLLAPLALALAWCFASVLWSAEPGLTVKRLIVLACCAVAALGLARHWSLDDWLTATWFILLGHVASGVFLELALGGFRPHLAGYRFSGTCDPNDQAVLDVGLCLSSLLLRERWREHRGKLLALAGLAFVCLVLTKSRTSLAGLILAGGAIWLLRTPWTRKAAFALAATWLAALAAFVILLADIPIAGGLFRAATLGRAENLESMSGRSFIWEELSYFVREQPWLGHGYETFWNKTHIQQVEQDFAIIHGHNAYLDATLNLGLIGLALLLATVAGGAALAGWRTAKGRDPAAAFLFAMLLFGLLNGLTESIFVLLSVTTFLLLVGLLILALPQTVPAEAVPRGGIPRTAG